MTGKCHIFANGIISFCHYNFSIWWTKKGYKKCRPPLEMFEAIIIYYTHMNREIIWKCIEKYSKPKNSIIVDFMI